jgi:flotillin
MKVAQAYKEFNEAALQLETLKLLPPVIDTLGPIFSAIAAPLGNIDRLTIYDSGGGGNAEGALQRYAGVAPGVVFDFLQKAKAVGLDVQGMLGKLGIRPEEFEQHLRAAAERAKTEGTRPKSG